MPATADRYYLVRPHPALRGRWAVMHRVPGTSALHVDADALTLAGAEREAAWLEAERAGVSTWDDGMEVDATDIRFRSDKTEKQL